MQINANLKLLKRDVNRLISESVGYEKTMWERIGMGLERVNVGDFGFDHPICSGVLDIKSELFTKIPASLCDLFKESFRKYKLDRNNVIIGTCEKFIHNEKSKVNSDEDLRDIGFGKWLDGSENLQEMTRSL